MKGTRESLLNYTVFTINYTLKYVTKEAHAVHIGLLWNCFSVQHFPYKVKLLENSSFSNVVLFGVGALSLHVPLHEPFTSASPLDVYTPEPLTL